MTTLFWFKFLLVTQMVKNQLQCRIPEFDPWVGKIPWRRECLPTPVFLPGEFHGQRSLVGYIWGCKESETTEQLTLKAIDLSLKFSLTKSGKTISLGGVGNQFVLMRL